MSRSSGCGTAEDACCRPQEEMVRQAVKTLEKLNEMFRKTLKPTGPGPRQPETRGGSPTERRRQKRVAKLAPDAYAKVSALDRSPAGASDPSRRDRNAMRLNPGEVGLRGDRATFHLGTGAEAAKPRTGRDGQPRTGRDGQPTGAVYYHMEPRAANAGTGAQQSLQRKHVMQVLPAVPATTDPDVGPVTGLPVKGNEHVLVLRLGKRYRESDDTASMLVEVRLPKAQAPRPTEIGTQYDPEDFQEIAIAPPSAQKDKDKKDKKGAKNKKGKKGKK